MLSWLVVASSALLVASAPSDLATRRLYCKHANLTDGHTQQMVLLTTKVNDTRQCMELELHNLEERR